MAGIRQRLRQLERLDNLERHWRPDLDGFPLDFALLPPADFWELIALLDRWAGGTFRAGCQLDAGRLTDRELDRIVELVRACLKPWASLARS